MELTYFGHSCFLLSTSKARILFDPFISPNPLAKQIDVDAIEADYILLSHGHVDHVTDVERIAQKNPKVKIISNYEIVSHFEKKGIEGHPMNLGGQWCFDFGTVKMVHAQHSSSFPDGSYAGCPAGFVLQADGLTLYYAGDTSLTYDMKLLAEEFALDYAFLPLGDNFTMGIKDALTASKWVNSNKIIGMHYDTFPLIKIDHEKSSQSFLKEGKELLLLTIGQKTQL
ncbi:MAG: metal-dependent hydrolase [Cytophagales bacterium]|nr:metal-dependent hydrolase [Cytophagales bacterium]